MHTAIKRWKSAPLMNGYGSKHKDEETLKLNDAHRSTESSHGVSRNTSFSISGDSDRPTERHLLLRKLHWHIMLRFCLLTVLNNLDRANLAYAAPQMNSILGYSDETYGTGSSIFFAGYMIFQIPSQLIASRVNIAKWLAFLLISWGVVATSFTGLTSSHAHLYILRFLLGVTEAGTFPAMWAYLTNFYAGGAELAAAWGFIGAAQPLAQVLGGPIASALLYADGFLGLRGYQWLFLLEGLPTILLGIWIYFTLAATPEEAHYLTPAERNQVAGYVKMNKEEIEKKTGKQDLKYVLKCWKVYAQGIGSGWAGILRFGAMYWTPLICYSIVFGQPEPGQDAPIFKISLSALLASIPFSWAAISTLFNSWLANKRGKLYLHCIVPIAIGSVALVILAVTLDHHPVWALFGLTLSATSQASNPLEWSYPATYLHGYGLTMGWAIANCISGFGGFVGPWLIGNIKEHFGSFVMPMSILAIVNTCAVVYFAVLLRFLPAKGKAGEPDPVESDEADIEVLIESGGLRSDRSYQSEFSPINSIVESPSR